MRRMEPFYQDKHRTVYYKDCREMSELSDESVQMVCCSPPYWGLRRYSGEQELIWGDNHCEHEWGENIPRAGYRSNDSHPGELQSIATQNRNVGYSNTCSLCGAWKASYGLEPTPELYVQHTIEILREIRRVLRKDGVVFWNIGDSYAANRSYQVTDTKWRDVGNTKASRVPEGLKPKDLCLIPFRVAIAAQEDGWWVRSVIIWAKPNPMPESVRDRPTESHEYILMLTKSGTTQYWTHRDSGGSRERPKPDYRWVNQLTQEEVAIEPPNWKEKIKCPDCDGTSNVDKEIGWYIQEDKCSTCNGKGKATLWKRINLWQGHDYYWDADAVREPQQMSSLLRAMRGWEGDTNRGYPNGPQSHIDKYFNKTHEEAMTLPGRNIRTVWEFATQPFPAAHFAVFPEKLPELCIKAATPEVGCCSKCGAPWERVIRKESIKRTRLVGIGQDSEEGTKGRAGEIETKTLGWQPTCKCNADKVPSVVCDPFAGAGTTLKVAAELGRRAVGYELSREYCQLIVDRCRQQVIWE